MLFSYLYSIKKKVLVFLIPLFLLPGLKIYSGTLDNFSAGQNPGKTVTFDPVFNINTSGSFSIGENKPGTQIKILAALNLTEKSHALNSFAAYQSTFKNESIPNFRRSAFITSHFSTST